MLVGASEFFASYLMFRFGHVCQMLFLFQVSGAV